MTRAREGAMEVLAQAAAEAGTQQAGRSLRSAARAAFREHAGGLSAGLLGSLTLGLAPYVPHAHVWKQLVSLSQGTLTQPIDIFDLVLHGAPWLVLGYAATRFVVSMFRHVRARRSAPSESR